MSVSAIAALTMTKVPKFKPVAMRVTLALQCKSHAAQALQAQALAQLATASLRGAKTFSVNSLVSVGSLGTS